MAMSNHEKLASMNWGEIEEALTPPPARGARAAKARTSDERALLEYFGEDEFEYLQKLASHSAMMRERASARDAPRGNVILVPGIMGSTLASTRGSDTDPVWVNFARLALGGVERLRLTPDGERDADSSVTVAAGALVHLAYARTILWLRARWEVVPFAFDWRKDIDTASDGLARLVREKFPNRPVHIVAHSMGGLVSRNFIRLHRPLWNKMRDAKGDHMGGRLVMLGTPNYGSYAIPQVMTGTETLVKWLARADLPHSRAEVVEILNTFVGSYQMLPAHDRIPAATRAIYRAGTWGDLPVSELHLQRALHFHDDLEKGDTIDPSRMFYVAGSGRETLSGMNILSPGEFDYTTTFDGDGRVTHELGLLKGVPTYYADASHGGLATKELVLTAVDELLERGSTQILPQHPAVSRSARVEGARWTRGAGGQEVGAELEAVARKVERNEATPEQLRKAEHTLQRALMGRDVQPAEIPHVVEGEDLARKKARSINLEVKVLRADITQAPAPLVAVGHYQGVALTGAVQAIDEALDFWISRADENGMIGLGLGQLFFIPVPEQRVTKRKIAARAVLLAGMGEPGKFVRAGDVRFLMTNVTQAAATLGLDKFATVVIGSGAGNMSKEKALLGIIQGVCEALHRVEKRRGVRLKQVLLVESDDEEYEQTVTLLKKFKIDRPVAELTLTVTTQRLPKTKRLKRKRPDDIATSSPDETRINVERSGDFYRFSAMTADAVIPVRDTRVKQKFVNDASERLMASLKRGEQEKYGLFLYSYLFPPDFHQAIDTNRPLTLVVDRATAGLPWEMACFRGSTGSREPTGSRGTTGSREPTGVTFLGPDLKLTRQFRTRLSSAPGVTPPPKKNLKVLVVADPAREPELQLPGALKEGRAVVKVLNEFKQKKKEDGLDIQIVERIGAAECDAVEILALILDENFDLIHYAGHGVFDTENPTNSGWVFGRDKDGTLSTLAAREIFKARRVPRLVFANACFSAVVREGAAASAEEMNRELAGMAEAFFERGVQNYIGAGWPVGDTQAVAFAKTFYEGALAGKTLGEALSDGRKAILDEGSTWGAYHHYGRANATLVAK